MRERRTSNVEARVRRDEEESSVKSAGRRQYEIPLRVLARLASDQTPRCRTPAISENSSPPSSVFGRVVQVTGGKWYVLRSLLLVPSRHRRRAIKAARLQQVAGSPAASARPPSLAVFGSLRCNIFVAMVTDSADRRRRTRVAVHLCPDRLCRITSSFPQSS